ncbi:MAG: alpha-hydroxy-acid oxidizing enzyme [Acidimicrobiaceae bacterium]|nr:alpha-hydroxy-acid oxidizing enzyme [Acidimicrobiaceae bacterium]MBC83491.1 alpha-hydroxy-acid oxidizing enzyme [Acidimicrobiaceae bacterium]|tara:strand:+ start:3186 stop:4373 length:1188 start_codon:yes stop_codon:yes gene_type:complete
MNFTQIKKLISLKRRSGAGIQTVDEFKELAKKRIPNAIWDFIEGGAGTEQAIQANRKSLESVLFQPKYLVDVSQRNTSAQIFGRPLKTPIILSPAGIATLAHPLGEIAVARAAAKADAIFCLSTGSGLSIEQVAEVSDGRLWFQLYLWKSQEVIDSLINRAKKAGYEALIITVDVPVVGKRERDLRNGMSLPVTIRPGQYFHYLRKPRWIAGVLKNPAITFGNLTDVTSGDDASSIGEYVNKELNDPSKTWDDVARIRSAWEGPLLIKGIMNPSDARKAEQVGANGIIVSNHGGRQFSSVPGVATIFPEIKKVVSKNTELFLDGGIRRGEDIVKAHALGATAACSGRSWFWALAADGEQGVNRILEILEKEVEDTLALIGEPKLTDVGPQNLFST